jgi:hypothetical protein
MTRRTSVPQMALPCSKGMSATHSSMPTRTQPLRATACDLTTLCPVLSITEAINTSHSSLLTMESGILHATPEYVFDERPIYVLEDLEILDEGHVQCTMIDCEVAELHDVTVHAEVIHYRALTANLAYLEGRLMELEKQWGEMSSKKLGCIRCLEMANVLTRLVTQHGDILDVKG